jgi:hypothetical protein
LRTFEDSICGTTTPMMFFDWVVISGWSFRAAAAPRTATSPSIARAMLMACWARLYASFMSERTSWA